MLFGEGEYYLKEIKEVEVTESYLRLGMDDRNCQNDEPYYNCTSRHYIKSILKKCGCLRLDMRLSPKVLNSI